MSKTLEEILFVLPFLTFFGGLIYGAMTQQVWIMFVGAGIGIICLIIRLRYENRAQELKH